IPGMLDDPAAEFRRDAVQRLLDEAAALQARQTSGEAHRIYVKALNSARDKDQAEAIVQALEKLGHQVNLAEHFGFIMDWKLIGPFDNTARKGFEVSYPPELEINLETAYVGK